MSRGWLTIVWLLSEQSVTDRYEQENVEGRPLGVTFNLLPIPSRTEPVTHKVLTTPNVVLGDSLAVT